MRTVIWVLFAVLLTGCSTDYLPFSSGALEGELAEPPADWAGVGELDVIRLETRPSEPYSVKLWVIEMDGALYVHAGDNLAQWVEYIDEDNRVRLGAEDKIYELSALRVVDQEVFDALMVPYKAKYGRRPGNENIEEVYLFRLQNR